MTNSQDLSPVVKDLQKSTHKQGNE